MNIHCELHWKIGNKIYKPILRTNVIELERWLSGRVHTVFGEDLNSIPTSCTVDSQPPEVQFQGGSDASRHLYSPAHTHPETPIHN